MSETLQGKLQVELLTVGWCTVPRAALEPIASDGRGPRWRDWFRTARCPALVLLIRHPTEGPVLIDTGYAPRFVDATRQWPERGYALTTPMTLPREQELLTQLAQRGISASDVRHIVLTHLHADHVAGVRDFPHATLHATAAAASAISACGDGFAARARATRAGMLRALLPDDFSARVQSFSERALDARDVPAELSALVGHTSGEALPRQVYDVFGDRSVLAVDVPGHAPGMVGIVLPTLARPLFLVADAVWSLRTLGQGARAGFAERRVAADVTVAAESIRRLQRFMASAEAPRYHVISSHDDDAIRAYSARRT